MGVPNPECDSCAEGDPEGECPDSERPCGHHCNHIWEQDCCHWCKGSYEAEAGEDSVWVPGSPAELPTLTPEAL